MSKLVYMFASLAARSADGSTCLEGMELLGRTLHPLGVRITWIVSPESARLAAGKLERWHGEFGDDAAVFVEFDGGTYGEKRDTLASARDEIGKALPWANLTVAGGCHTDGEIAGMLEETGFEGVWGFCWEQIEVDQITDRGCPWGLYYLDRDQRLRPAQGRGIVGMEWTARDLLKSFHSGNPCLYSTDPNDVARGGICSWEDIGYWKRMADNYVRNLRYNEEVYLLQHQEAHEMERSAHCRCYTEEDVREAAVMLDGFVRHLKEGAGDALTMMTLSEAAGFYRERNDGTASSYMLWEDAATPPYNRDYAWSTPCGPWPKTFLYYDRGAQMMFVEGKVEPVCVRNYGQEWKAGEFFAEGEVPRTRLVRDTRYPWRREIELVVGSPRAMPYGIALWGDYSLYQLGECPGLVEGKMMSRELLFLRYELEAGENRLGVALEGK